MEVSGKRFLDDDQSFDKIEDIVENVALHHNALTSIRSSIFIFTEKQPLTIE
jgi:hypothetical protein